MSLQPANLGRRSRLIAGYVLVFGCVAATALLAATPYALYGVVAAGLLLATGIWFAEPTIFAVLAIPATLVIIRLGGGAGSGLSVSDAVLFAGSTSGILLIDWEHADELRPMLWAVAGYQALLVLVVLAHPNRYDSVEWVHRYMEAGGGLIVGWILAYRNKARAALSTFIGLAAMLSVYAIINAITHHLNASHLKFGLQKNYVGDMLAMAVLVAHVNPSWADLGKRWSSVAKYVCILGILAVVSKQAIAGLAVGLIFVSMRGRHLGKRSKIILVTMLPLTVISYIIVFHEISSHNRFNSFHTRKTVFAQALTIWSHSPWFGEGMRFFYLPQFAGNIQTPNMEIGALASTGIVGLIGLLALMAIALRRTWRLPPRLGSLAVAITLYHLVQGQLDIFWVAAQGSLPWMIIGLAVGATDKEHSQFSMGAQRSLMFGGPDRELIP